VRRTERTLVRGIAGAVALVAVGAALGGGCDWFDDPIEPNLLPETTIETCPGEIEAGTDAAITWSGSDPDGSVASFAWTFDDTVTGMTTSTSAIFDSVGAGSHAFSVAAVDDDGDADPSPATCTFVAIDEEENLPPETEITVCPVAPTAGDDVTIAWSGTDLDGTVEEYRWSLDGSGETTTADTTLVIEDVAAGQHVFSVAAVDDDGDADATPAVCDFAAAEAGEPVPRVVMVEYFTSLTCSNCPNGEAALLTMLDEYGADSLCVVGYHDQGPPDGPDVLATPEMMDRIDWYTDVYGYADELPLALFDGDFSRPVVGAPSVQAAETAYRIEIDVSSTMPSPLSVRLSGSIDGARGSVTITVRAHDEPTDGPLVLRTVVVEDEVSSQGRVFDFVARDLLDDEELTMTAVGDSAVVVRSFDVGPGWNADHLDVIAFVQDDGTREILQAGCLGGVR